jgi:hypothetical protein
VLRTAGEARGLHAAHADHIVRLDATKYFLHSTCSKLRCNGAQCAPRHAAATVGRRNDEGQACGSIGVDLDIDHADAYIALLDDPGASVDYAISTMLGWWVRRQPQDQLRPATIPEPATRLRVVEPLPDRLQVIAREWH